MKNNKPQFKDIKFAQPEELFKWLDQTASKRINLKDLGQDILTIWIHETGEILNSDFNSDNYRGKFVSIEQLEVGRGLVINGKKYLALIISGINEMKPTITQPEQEVSRVDLNAEGKIDRIDSSLVESENQGKDS